MALESFEPETTNTPGDETPAPAPLPAWLDPNIPTDEVELIVVPVQPNPADRDTMPTTPDHNN